MQRLTDERERMTAALHDVIEDTELTADDLAAAGMPPEVIHAVEILTRADGEPYDRFIRRIADSGDPVARAVKRADFADNGDPERLAKLPEDERVRLAEKYAEGRRILDAPSATT